MKDITNSWYQKKRRYDKERRMSMVVIMLVIIYQYRTHAIIMTVTAGPQGGLIAPNSCARNPAAGPNMQII